MRLIIKYDLGVADKNLEGRGEGIPETKKPAFAGFLSGYTE
jgi:hypothetical protein